MSAAATRGARVVVVFAVYAAAHFMSNFFRTANAVLAQPLTAELGLTPAQLGIMSSVLLGTFALAQLPFGSAIDRYGPNRVTAVLMLVGVAGAVVFGTARSFGVLTVGRALLGLGTAGILMGGLKALSMLVPPHRFAAVSGMLTALGTSGALLATAPLEVTLRAFGWRAAFLGGAALLFASAAAVYATARPLNATFTNPAAGKSRPSANGLAPVRDGFAAIFSSGPFWRMAFVAFAQVGTLFAYQGLWAGPYLTDGVGLSPRTAGTLLLLLSLGQMVGYFVSGWVAQRVGLARTLVMAGTLSVLLQVLLAVTVGYGNALAAGTLLAGFSLSSSFALLLYAQANVLFPPRLTGRVVTAINLFMFLGGFVVQAGLGLLVGVLAMTTEGRAPAGAYAAAFLATAVLGAAALIGYLPLLRRSSGGERVPSIGGPASAGEVDERPADGVDRRG